MVSKRDNLLYKLRKKGIRCITKERIIFIPYGSPVNRIVQVQRLRRDFHFNVQFYIE